MRLEHFALRSRDKSADPEIVSEILEYFIRNPTAVDSLEGVARWRLMNEAIRRSVVETEMALRWLVTHGFLEEISRPGLTPIFSLKAERLNVARDLLAQLKSPSKRRRSRNE
jgi:hypothetical protein